MQNEGKKSLLDGKIRKLSLVAQDKIKTCYMCCDFPPKFPQILKISHKRRSRRLRLFPCLRLILPKYHSGTKENYQKLN